MDTHLIEHDWFVAGVPTIADIALFAYTHVAEEGDFDLSAYPNVRRWIARIEGLPEFVPMESDF